MLRDSLLVREGYRAVPTLECITPTWLDNHIPIDQGGRGAEPFTFLVEVHRPHLGPGAAVAATTARTTIIATADRVRSALIVIAPLAGRSLEILPFEPCPPDSAFRQHRDARGRTPAGRSCGVGRGTAADIQIEHDEGGIAAMSANYHGLSGMCLPVEGLTAGRSRGW